MKRLKLLNEIIIIVSLLGKLTVTSYRSVPAQTDDSPFNTSTGEHVHSGGVAISRDLLCPACRKLHHRCKQPANPTKLHYGDWLYSPKYGFLQINDVMGVTKYDKKTKKRYKITNAIDIWVPNYKAEHAVGLTVQPVYKVGVE